MPTLTSTCKQFVPVIASDDVLKTVEYYIDVLGFRKHFIYGEPPVYAAVTRDESLLYITLDRTLVETMKTRDLHPDVFLWVDGVDELYMEHKASGAKIFEEISDRPWDARQYVIEDPAGYRLKIAQPID